MMFFVTNFFSMYIYTLLELIGGELKRNAQGGSFTLCDCILDTIQTDI